MKLTPEQRQKYLDEGMTEEQVQALENGGDNNLPPEDPPNPFSPAVLAAIQASNNARQQAEEENRRLQQQLNDRNNDNGRLPILEPGEAYTNPEKLRAVINQDLVNTIAPLNNFMLEFQRKEQYTLVKNRVKSMQPQLAIILNAGLETFLDNVFFSNPSLVPTEANIVSQIKMLAGEYAISQMGNQNQNQNQNQNNNNNNNNQNNNNQNNNYNNNSDMLPPHLRPSNRTSQQNNQDTFDESQFDENDRRLARENKMSLKEWGLMKKCDAHDADKVWKQILADRKAGVK